MLVVSAIGLILLRQDSVFIGYVSSPQPKLKKKAQANLKKTQQTRAKSSPSYAQHLAKEKAEGSHGDRPGAGQGGVVAIPGTARWFATATTAQKAAYIAKLRLNAQKNKVIVQQWRDHIAKLVRARIATINALRQKQGLQQIVFTKQTGGYQNVGALPGGVGAVDFGDIGVVNAQKIAKAVTDKPENKTDIVNQAVAEQVQKAVKAYGKIPRAPSLERPAEEALRS